MPRCEFSQVCHSASDPQSNNSFGIWRCSTRDLSSYQHPPPETREHHYIFLTISRRNVTVFTGCEHPFAPLPRNRVLVSHHNKIRPRGDLRTLTEPPNLDGTLSGSQGLSAARATVVAEKIPQFPVHSVSAPTTATNSSFGTTNKSSLNFSRNKSSLAPTTTLLSSGQAPSFVGIASGGGASSGSAQQQSSNLVRSTSCLGLGELVRQASDPAADKVLSFEELHMVKRLFGSQELVVTRDLRLTLEGASVAVVTVAVERYGVRISQRGWDANKLEYGPEGRPSDVSSTASFRARAAGRGRVGVGGGRLAPNNARGHLSRRVGGTAGPRSSSRGGSRGRGGGIAGGGAGGGPPTYSLAMRDLAPREFYLLTRGHQGLVMAVDSQREGAWVKFDLVPQVTFIDYVDLLVFFELESQKLFHHTNVPRLKASGLAEPGFGFGRAKRLEEMLDVELPHTLTPGRILHVRAKLTPEEEEEVYQVACNDYTRLVSWDVTKQLLVPNPNGRCSRRASLSRACNRVVEGGVDSCSAEDLGVAGAVARGRPASGSAASCLLLPTTSTSSHDLRRAESRFLDPEQDVSIWRPAESARTVLHEHDEQTTQTASGTGTGGTSGEDRFLQRTISENVEGPLEQERRRRSSSTRRSRPRRNSSRSPTRWSSRSSDVDQVDAFVLGRRDEKTIRRRIHQGSTNLPREGEQQRPPAEHEQQRPPRGGRPPHRGGPPRGGGRCSPDRPRIAGGGSSSPPPTSPIVKLGGELGGKAIDGIGHIFKKVHDIVHPDFTPKKDQYPDQSEIGRAVDHIVHWMPDPAFEARKDSRKRFSPYAKRCGGGGADDRIMSSSGSGPVGGAAGALLPRRREYYAVWVDPAEFSFSKLHADAFSNHLLRNFATGLKPVMKNFFQNMGVAGEFDQNMLDQERVFEMRTVFEEASDFGGDTTSFEGVLEGGISLTELRDEEDQGALTLFGGPNKTSRERSPECTDYSGGTDHPTGGSGGSAGGNLSNGGSFSRGDLLSGPSLFGASAVDARARAVSAAFGLQRSRELPGPGGVSVTHNITKSSKDDHDSSTRNRARTLSPCQTGGVGGGPRAACQTHFAGLSSSFGGTPFARQTSFPSDNRASAARASGGRRASGGSYGEVIRASMMEEEAFLERSSGVDGEDEHEQQTLSSFDGGVVPGGTKELP